MVTEQIATFRAGDRVELTDDVPGRKELKDGARGVVVVGNDQDLAGVWHMVSVVLGTDPDRSQAWLLHPRHLKRVQS